MFRFSIRDVLWLTVVVGLGIGWWADHRELSARAAISSEWMTEQVKETVTAIQRAEAKARQNP